MKYKIIDKETGQEVEFEKDYDLIIMNEIISDLLDIKFEIMSKKLAKTFKDSEGYIPFKGV